jgi:beta-lactamase regulating signal transducer with metallopeptidase domain
MTPHDALARSSEWIWPLVADHLWEATLFACVGCAAAALLRHGPARTRHAVWLMVAAKIALPSFVLALAASTAGLDLSAPLRVASESGEPIPAAMTVVTAAAAPVRSYVGRAADGTGATHDEVFCALTLVWASGFACAAGLLLLRRRALSQALASARALTAGRELEILERARRMAGVPARVSLLLSPGVAQPGVCGVLRPRIVLPVGIADRLGDDELEAVFLHEIAHVRRRDNLVATAHAALCCVFWFFPPVWFVDRRLLAERERACDEAVIALNAASRVYASSLVKVCRFGLEAPTPGVSAATGSDLRRRIDAILGGFGDRRLTRTHRALLGATAACLVLFGVAGSIAADGQKARPAASDEGVWFDGIGPYAERIPPVPVRFENADDAPVLVRAAETKLVPASGGLEHILPPVVTMENVTGRVVSEVRVSFGDDGAWRDVVPFPVTIAPRGRYVLRPDYRRWLNTRAAGKTTRLAVRVTGVTFADGGSWGQRDRVAPEVAAPASGEEFPAGFENPPGAPLVVVDARSKAAGDGYAALPTVTVSNTTDRRIVVVKLRFKAGADAHAVTVQRVDIGPSGRHVFASDTTLAGSPDRVTVQVVGVEFENGDVWGLLDSTIDSRWPDVPVPNAIRPKPEVSANEHE